MWVARSLCLLMLIVTASAFADNDPSVPTLPGAGGGSPPSTIPTPPTTTQPTTPQTTSSSDLGSQVQQNTATAMKTFQNLTYKKLSAKEDQSNYDESSDTPKTSFSLFTESDQNTTDGGM